MRQRYSPLAPLGLRRRERGFALNCYQGSPHVQHVTVEVLPLQAYPLLWVLLDKKGNSGHTRALGAKGRTKTAKQRYNYLKPQEVYICPKRCFIFGLRLHLAVIKSKEGELVTLVCNPKPEQALVRYARRWQIETLFSALKTRGFNIEDTHMTTSTRFNKLLALLVLAFTC